MKSLLILVVLVAAAACSASDPSPSSQNDDDASGSADAFYTAAANPTVVTPLLDAPRAVSAVIPTTGGTLTATAADGSTFRLSLPNDALLEDTEITLTPLVGVTGLPFVGGLIAGVDIAPDGLDLAQFATLELAPAGPATSEQTLFGYATVGATHELFLTRPEAGATVATKIIHFSGYGSAGGSSGGQPNRQPSNPYDRLTQKLASGVPLILVEELSAYEQQVLKPRLAAPPTSCAEGEKTIVMVLQAQRLSALLGAEFNFADVSESYFTAYIDACIEEATCRRPRLLGLQRNILLLGRGDSTAEAAVQAELARCDSGWRGSIEWTVNGMATTSDSTATTTFTQTKTRAGSGSMTFQAAPNGVSPSGGVIPIASIQANDSFVDDSVGTNTDGECVYTQHRRESESGTTTIVRNDGTAYAFISLFGSSYTLQLIGLEVPTNGTSLDETFQRCAPDTSDTPTGSSNQSTTGSLGVIITETLDGAIGSSDPARFQGSRTFAQGADPELTITISWDFTRPL